MENERQTTPAGTSRRRLLVHGAKLAYVVPLILASARAEPVFAGVSGGHDGDDGHGGHHGHGGHLGHSDRH